MAQQLAVAIIFVCCLSTLDALDSPFPIQFEEGKAALLYVFLVNIHASRVPRYGSKRMLRGLKSGIIFCKICNFSLYLIQNSLNGT
jgi:hypothetical protein